MVPLGAAELRHACLTGQEPMPYWAAMPARPRRPRDPAPDGGKNPAAVSLGRLGGLKGGNARAKALTAKRRKAIASKAGKARWNKARTGR